MFARSPVLALSLGFAATGAHSQPSPVLTGYPAAVQQATACMIDVLRRVPGITAPNVGVVPAGHVLPWMDGDRHATGPTPFVSYTWWRPPRWASLPASNPTVTFVAVGDLSNRKKLQFLAMLEDHSPSGRPDDLGARKVETLWKRQCSVNAEFAFG
jgi:hypothetical protein